jgi:chromosome segregation ATPase
MDVWGWLSANWEGVTGLIGAIVGGLALWQKGVEARRTAKVKQAADAISGYANLCDELQEELAIDRAYRLELEKRIKSLESQISDLRAELDAEKRDNNLLRERIRVLEDEREKLKAELEALRNKAGA